MYIPENIQQMDVPQHDINAIKCAADLEAVCILNESKTETDKKYRDRNRVDTMPELARPNFYFLYCTTWFGCYDFTYLQKTW